MVWTHILTLLTCPAREQRKYLGLRFILRVSNSLGNQDFFNHVSVLNAGGAAAMRPALGHTHGPLPHAPPSTCVVGRVGIPRALLGGQLPHGSVRQCSWREPCMSSSRAGLLLPVSAALCVWYPWSELLGHGLSSHTVSFTKWQSCLVGGGPRPINPSVISAVKLSHQRRRRHPQDPR